MKKLFSYIHGRYIKEQTDNFDIIENPATGEPIAKAYHASENILNEAIQSAQAGFLEWQSFSNQKKGKTLFNLSERLMQLNDELALIEVTDTGKPLAEANCVDIISGADCIKYYSGLTDKIMGLHQAVEDGLYYTKREPLGICLGIGAWNYPIQIACWKAAPCLAAGNSMIYKPSPLTPQTSLKLAEIMLEVGIPKGCFNVVLGDKAVAEYLISHQDIAKVSFTGSVATGKKVMSQAGLSITPTTMELGGKSPIIVCQDADLDIAVAGAILGNFYTQGEVCSNGTRVFVHQSVYDKFIEKLCKSTKNIKIGDPLDLKTQMGALISKAHLDKVLGYIKIGLDEGAKLCCGGKQIKPKNALNGYFIEPTIFADCKDNMRITKEEIFGPVMCVLKFSDIDEVIDRGNSLPFGLAAGIFTKDITNAINITDRLKAGTCWVNTYNITPSEMPFGGYKQSGVGRENGIEAINQYTQVKSVYIAKEPLASPY